MLKDWECSRKVQVVGLSGVQQHAHTESQQDFAYTREEDSKNGSDGDTRFKNKFWRQLCDVVIQQHLKKNHDL